MSLYALQHNASDKTALVKFLCHFNIKYIILKFIVQPSIQLVWIIEWEQNEQDMLGIMPYLSSAGILLKHVGCC